VVYVGFPGAYDRNILPSGITPPDLFNNIAVILSYKSIPQAGVAV